MAVKPVFFLYKEIYKPVISTIYILYFLHSILIIAKYVKINRLQNLFIQTPGYFIQNGFRHECISGKNKFSIK